MYNEEKPIIVDNVNESYEEIVKELKEKYSEEILRNIDEIKRQSYGQLSSAFNDCATGLLEEIEDLKKEIDRRKKEFYMSTEYSEAQAKLVTLRKELSASDDDSKSEIEKKLSRTMDRVSTLNVTIKNRLKPLSDKLKEDISTLKAVYSSSENGFAKIRDEFLDRIDDVITDGITSFNEELSEINAKFGIFCDKTEFPFDENTLKIKIELFPKELTDEEPDENTTDKTCDSGLKN